MLITDLSIRLYMDLKFSLFKEGTANIIFYANWFRQHISLLLRKYRSAKFNLLQTY